MEKQEKGRLKLVLVPCPFQGHINPMLQLGTFFHSRGFSITVVHAQYNSPNPSSHPDFHFLPLPDTSSDHNILTGQITAFLTKLNTNSKDRFQECLAGVKGQHGSDHGISCIIHDEFMYFSGEVATDLKLPSIIFRTNSAATFLARAVLIQLMAEGNFPFPESRSQDPVPELYPLRFKDLPLPLSGTFGISPIVNKASDSKTSSAIIHNTIDCLESSLLAKIQQQYQVPIFPIGPVHRIASTSSSSVLEEDRSCLAWLEKQSCNSVIYVSLGSVASMDVNEIVEMAWGLANSRQSFLWVIRPGSVRGAEWTEVLPQDLKEDISKRSYIVKWAPQKEVLVHGAVGGFLSHCGWNSTLESISEGIPMICRPCFGDQRVNTRYLTEVWRVGLELEGELERGEIEKAIRRLMVDEEGKELRKRANILKEKVELCLKEEAHVFKADLPGLKKEEVKVEIEENRVLQISGERNVEKEDKNDKWHKVERSSGKFVRSFRLPESVKIEEVKASMENGVLTVTVPKEEVKKPDSKAIEISG